ncbi:hypothetical protein Shel_18740 [Slackia heliotrinireducens DSM 20476]|uniref:Uncharacterized protein n=2 Tax=Slackia TaxID=84108 RepID=C7N7K5_SLAHD|nr:hypothetical protein Shel_18740 [Slackia heliotrinireducens DSM 20476]
MPNSLKKEGETTMTDLVQRTQGEGPVGRMCEEGREPGILLALREAVSQDPGQCGLLTVSAPTGERKTHSVLELIADSLVEHGGESRRFVFATDVKRNLPAGRLNGMLAERGRPELSEYVLFYDSNAGMFERNIDAATALMGQKPVRYVTRGKRDGGTGTWSSESKELDVRALPELDRATRALASLKGAKGASIKDPAVRRDAIEAAESRFEEAERAFRRRISGVFREMGVDKGGRCRFMTLKEKRRVLEGDPAWKWLGVLYPSVFAYRARAVFMSVSKLLAASTPIVEPSEPLLGSDLLRGSVLFIDEFELSKRVINRALIEEATNTMSDAVSLLRTLHGPSQEGRRLFEAPSGTDASPRSVRPYADERARRASEVRGRQLTADLFRSPDSSKERGEALLQERGKLVEASDDVYAALRLERQFRLSDDVARSARPFLFEDFRTTVVCREAPTSGGEGAEGGARKLWAALRFEQNRNTVDIVRGHEPFSRHDQKNLFPAVGETYALHLALKRVEGVLGWSLDWIGKVAENYARAVAADAEKGLRPEISVEQAIGTVLAELNVLDEVDGTPNPTRERLIALVRGRRGHWHAGAAGEYAGPEDLSIHGTGFRYHSLERSPSHDTTVRMERCELPCTAEKVLLDLCGRNLVVGVSATLDIRSVLGNYDMGYVDDALGDRRLRFTDAQKSLIEADYRESVDGYDRVRIEVESVSGVDDNGEYGPKAWESVFADPSAARRACNEVEMSLPEGGGTFRQQRILKVCTAYRRFFADEDSRAMLCVLNRLPKPGDGDFGLELLEGLFGAILAELGSGVPPRATYAVLGGDDFEERKRDALARLAAGEKLFLVTTYASAGAGQNLQYPVPEGVSPVKINGFPATGEMDIDCCYLERPTHMSPSITGECPIGRERAMEHILGCEYLYENGEISYAKLLSSAESALTATKGAAKDYGFMKDGLESVQMYAAKEVYQACGRLNRTNMKMPVIRLFVDAGLLDGVSLEELEGCGVTFTPEFQAIVEHFEARRAPAEGCAARKEAKRLALEQQRACARSKTAIGSLLGSRWRRNAIEAWRALGECVLKNPKPSGDGDVPAHLLRSYYLRAPRPSMELRYRSEGDFAQVEVLDGPGAGGRPSFAVSSADARLEELLRIPGVREEFERSGYATEWRASEWFMTPVVFQSIYKGRLGEVCGRTILEACGFEVAGIDDPLEFEKFDFTFSAAGGGRAAYVDFKHWKAPSDKLGAESEEYRRWAFEKMRDVGAERAVVANVLPPDGRRLVARRYRDGDGRGLLVVPALVAPDLSYDVRAIGEIRDFIEEER